jgi:hypothetical protein
MHQHLLLLAAVIGGATNAIGFIPYARDIFRHKTKPERAMWWIYTVLFTLLLAAQMSAGARWLLIVSAEYVLTSATIAFLSIGYGYGRFHKRDIVSICVALLGFILWRITDSPLLAILVVIIIDFAGFWLTIIKTWRAPHSETLISWQLALASAAFSIFSIGSWKVSLLAYPLYAVVGDALLVWVIVYRRRVITDDPTDF